MRVVSFIIAITIFHFSSIGQTNSSSGNYIQEPTDSTSEFFSLIDIPEIKVIANKERLLGAVPGSGAYLGKADLQQVRALSGNEILRQVSGVHVVDEEGLGLRANIGIRGLDPDRSAKVLILEDGIPVALNPFGEPQLYYTPTMDRMEGVEVLKGSGQILFGPQTIGGVINYITAAPPKEQSGHLKLTGGQGGFFSGLLGYGNTNGNVGYQVNYLRKQGDQIGPTWFRLNDLTGKIKLTISDRTKVGIKLGYYDEVSNSTYVGLSQGLYDNANYDFETLAPNDLLAVNRISASITHETHWNYKVKLQTTAFGYKTNRNWQRQDFKYSNTSPLDYFIGDSTQTGAIYFLDKNGHRNRQFEVAGFEPRLTYRFETGIVNHKLEAGTRILFERAFEQRVNGTKGDAPSGTLVNDETRTGKALSVFLQDRATINKVSLTAGLRMENYQFERDIHRLSQVDTAIIAEQQVFQIIPGIGVNYKLSEKVGIFAGLHRGFAPPRVKDAIASSGEVYQLEPELSWNLELGTRAYIGELLDLELTLFNMDFSNQIIPISESSGGLGSGFVNGGKSLHQGIEFGMNWNFGKLIGSEQMLNWKSQLTFLRAIYSEDRFKEVDGELINIKDNATPYTPSTTLTSSIHYEAPKGLRISLIGNYTSSQFTDELNTELPSSNGRIGKLPAYFLMDAVLGYELKKQKLSFHISGKNLLDERYISTRRPQGIRVGLGRYISAGLDYTF